jgi:enolase
MENISKHITYAEATRSEAAQQRGIANTPDTVSLSAMKRTAERIFEPLRSYIGEPIRVNSFFRTPQVNTLIGGSTSSQHMKGEAMDIGRFAGSGYSNAEIFWFIRENLEFDQLIWEMGTDGEPDWVHVSLKPSGNRREVLQAYKSSGITKYKIFTLLKKIVEKKKK